MDFRVRDSHPPCWMQKLQRTLLSSWINYRFTAFVESNRLLRSQCKHLGLSRVMDVGVCFLEHMILSIRLAKGIPQILVNKCGPE